MQSENDRKMNLSELVNFIGFSKEYIHRSYHSTILTQEKALPTQCGSLSL